MQKTLFSILVLLVCISHPSKATSFIYNVTDYGVKANSGRSETASLQKIIDLCSTNGMYTYRYLYQWNIISEKQCNALFRSWSRTERKFGPK